MPRDISIRIYLDDLDLQGQVKS